MKKKGWLPDAWDAKRPSCQAGEGFFLTIWICLLQWQRDSSFWITFSVAFCAFSNSDLIFVMSVDCWRTWAATELDTACAVRYMSFYYGTGGLARHGQVYQTVMVESTAGGGEGIDCQDGSNHCRFLVPILFFVFWRLTRLYVIYTERGRSIQILLLPYRSVKTTPRGFFF